jgi:hypothetical protein
MQDAIAASRDMLKRCDAVRQAQTDACGAAAIVQPDSDAWCAVYLCPLQHFGKCTCTALAAHDQHSVGECR